MTLSIQFVSTNSYHKLFM